MGQKVVSLVLVVLLSSPSLADARDVYMTRPPLHQAVTKGDIKKVRTILAKGTPVDQRAPHRETALMFAARAGKKNIYDYLLTQGADVKLIAASEQSWGEIPYLSRLHTLMIDESGTYRKQCQ